MCYALISVRYLSGIRLSSTYLLDHAPACTLEHFLKILQQPLAGNCMVHLQLPAASIDVETLHDATRREARGG